MSNISLKNQLIDLGYNVDFFEETTVEMFRTGLGSIAQGAQQEWIRLAQARLNTSRFDYINGLRKNESLTEERVAGEPIFTLKLLGEFANAREFGMDSFDMKTSRPGWLGGSKAKINKKGKRYISIPFRHSTGSSPRFQYTGKAKQANLQQELKRVTKDQGLNRMVRDTAGNVSRGRVATLSRKVPTHSYLKGLTRIQRPNESNPKTGSSMLMTFRTMSEDSDASSWIHPGLDAANLLPEVERWVDGEINKMITMVMKESA